MKNQKPSQNGLKRQKLTASHRFIDDPANVSPYRIKLALRSIQPIRPPAERYRFKDYSNFSGFLLAF